MLEFLPKSNKWQNDPLVWIIGCGSGVSHCLWRDIGLTLHGIIYFYCRKFPFCIFISVFNQLDAQNLFHSKFYFMPIHVSSICAHQQEVKIALHSLWYHHTYRLKKKVPSQHVCGTATYRCDDTRGCVMQFLPPHD